MSVLFLQPLQIYISADCAILFSWIICFISKICDLYSIDIRSIWPGFWPENVNWFWILWCLFCGVSWAN